MAGKKAKKPDAIDRALRAGRKRETEAKLKARGYVRDATGRVRKVSDLQARNVRVHFIQIAYASGVLYALDDRGRVFTYHGGGWARLANDDRVLDESPVRGGPVV